MLDFTVIFLKCPSCGKVHSTTGKIKVIDIRRNWQEYVSQKELINSSDINLCCKVGLEYYIGKDLARTILFGGKNG